MNYNFPRTYQQISDFIDLIICMQVQLSVLCDYQLFLIVVKCFKWLLE